MKGRVTPCRMVVDSAELHTILHVHATQLQASNARAVQIVRFSAKKHSGGAVAPDGPLPQLQSYTHTHTQA
eukprot:1158184-Pelagomonas_calceolata.AAC.8